MRSPRALLVILGCAALALTALQGLTGIGLLLSGRFIGEEAILARHAGPAPKPRPLPKRWTPVRERPLASLLERSTRQLRGPPGQALRLA